MGGSPSERKMSSSNTKQEKAERYLQNKKGRTSFFLYHRTAPSTTANVPKQLPLPATAAITNAKQITEPTSSKSQSPPIPMLLEMEVVSSSSDSEESDDNFTTTTPDNTNGRLPSPSAVRRIRRRSRSTATTGTTAAVVVEPHVATRVQFANIEVRSYSITIGDHPCCTIGCPITLDWEYKTEDTVSIQEYETLKYGNGNDATLNKKMNEFRISPEERVELLLQSSSLSELEIRRASRKFHRNKNCSLRQCERIHETFFHCRDRTNEDSSEEEEEDDDDDENDRRNDAHHHHLDEDDSTMNRTTEDEK